MARVPPKPNAREISEKWSRERKVQKAVSLAKSLGLEGPPSWWQIAGYAAAAAIAAIVGTLLLVPTVHIPDPLHSQILRESDRIVVVGDDVNNLHAEFHMQPQVNDKDGIASFPDGLTFLVGPTQPGESDGADLSKPVFLAIPHDLMNDPDTLPIQVNLLGEECTSQLTKATPSELPEPARQLVEDHSVIKLVRPSDCWNFRFDFDAVAPLAYEVTEYSVALRLPPIAYFDRESQVNIENSTEASEGDPAQCFTYILQDSYDLRASEWLGLENRPVLFPSYRTEAIYYGGTDDRPVTWVAGPRPASSGIQAPCVTQGIGIDLDRPGAAEKKAQNQIVAGFLFGLAAGFVIPAIESANKRIRWRKLQSSLAA